MAKIIYKASTEHLGHEHKLFETELQAFNYIHTKLHPWDWKINELKKHDGYLYTIQNWGITLYNSYGEFMRKIRNVKTIEDAIKEYKEMVSHEEFPFG